MILQHNEYMNFERLTQVLKDFEKKFPDLCELKVIGQTEKNFDIWMMTITKKNSNKPTKPGFWVDGNTHATELAGSQACIYLIDYLLSASETPEIKDLLENVVFYIVPRISVEGAEAALSERKLYRSSPAVFPLTVPQEDFICKDMNSDNEILFMRVEDSAGAFKVCPNDSRLMISREPYDSTGPFYHLFPEGEFKNFDGFRKNYSNPNCFDLNRQAPAGFSPSEYGAGPIPLYLKEAKVLANNFIQRPNIFGVTTHHTFGGVLLRPSSTRPDSDFDTHDLEVFKVQGKIGEEVTGYKGHSTYHDFKYNPKKSTTGVWDDWHYDHRGVFSWTTEIWNLAFHAGVKVEKPLETYQNMRSENLRKMFLWCIQNLNQDEFFQPWTSFNHPQLGKVEIGGWKLLFTVFNPPPKFLAIELNKVTQFTIKSAMMGPRVTAEVFKIENWGKNIFSVKIKIKNSGYLPTYGSEMAKSIGIYDTPRAYIKLNSDLKLKEGKAELELKHLTGRSKGEPWISPLWGSEVNNSNEELIHYVIEAGDNSDKKIEWTANYGFGGQIKLQINL